MAYLTAVKPAANKGIFRSLSTVVEFRKIQKSRSEVEDAFGM